MYFISYLSGCGLILQPLKILLYNQEGWLCVCGVLSSFPFALSIVVNLPNSGVYLSLKSPIYKVYFICYNVLKLAPVSCKLWQIFVSLPLNLGTEDGPLVHTKLHSSLAIVASLKTNL